jgi:hypothetical protein
LDSSTKLIKVSHGSALQTHEHASFVGGRPRLPVSFPLPLCGLCGERQTFFFQVAFPADHVWSGRTLAVFQCTCCIDDEHLAPLIRRSLFPAMKNNYLLPGDDIPDHALERIQTRWRFLAFPTAGAVPRAEYREKIRFRPIWLKPFADPKSTIRSKVGPTPGWVAAASDPGLYMGKPLSFLMQWGMFFKFDLLPDAPPPFDPLMDRIPELKEIRHYDLIIGKQLYFFGNQVDSSLHVYLCSQRN